MKVTKVKYERSLGGTHNEMGSARINPVTGKREFHPWSGLGTFGEVFEGENYEFVDQQTGRFVDPSESGDVFYHRKIGRCIKAMSGELIDITRLLSLEFEAPDRQKKLLSLEFETKYNEAY